jgi:hypothetical protein
MNSFQDVKTMLLQNTSGCKLQKDIDMAFLNDSRCKDQIVGERLKLGGFSKGPPMLFSKRFCDVVEVAIIRRKI